MVDLVLRPSSLDPKRPFALQLRWHESLGETEYVTLARVEQSVADEIIRAGAACYLFGEKEGDGTDLKAEIAALRSQIADAQATAQAWWYEDSTGCFHMSLDMEAGERRKRDLGVAINYLYGAPIEHQPAAWRDVVAERQRQIEVETFDASHDDMATRGQLAGAAACYALTAAQHWAASQGVETFWPWDKQWWKPGDKRRNLVKAAALLLAEIERLDRIDNGTSITLQAIIDKTAAHVAAMSPKEREAMLAAQRESFVRGMSTPWEHGQLDFETCPACRAAAKANGSE